MPCLFLGAVGTFCATVVHKIVCYGNHAADSGECAKSLFQVFGAGELPSLNAQCAGEETEPLPLIERGAGFQRRNTIACPFGRLMQNSDSRRNTRDGLLLWTAGFHFDT